MNTKHTTTHRNIGSEVITSMQLGERIRVINIETGRCYNGKLAALWPKDNAISVDVGRKRIYFNCQMSGVWILRDLAIPTAQ